MSLLTDLYGDSKSPYLKAADNEGFNKIVQIRKAEIDEMTFPGEKPKKAIIIHIGADKPVWLSRTNADALIAQFTDTLELWTGKKIMLQTKAYNIDGKNTVGWITLPMPKEDFDDAIPFG